MLLLPPADHGVPELRTFMPLSLLEGNMKGQPYDPPSEWKVVGEGPRSQLPVWALEAL